MTIPRRTIQELQTVHSLDDRIFDVVVEGPRDKHFYTWALTELGVVGAVVREVEGFHVDNDTTTRHQMPLNHRGRVLALGIEMADYSSSFCGVVDADFDHVLGVEPPAESTLYTDYANLECYALTAKTLGKLIGVGLNVTCDVPKLFQALTLVLQQLFWCRLANVTLGWKMPWVPPAASVHLEPTGTLTLDFDAFVRRLLTKGRRLQDREAFVSRISAHRDALTRQDCRYHVHGHDLVEVLLFYVRKRKRPAEWSEDSCRASLLTAIGPTDIEDEHLFRVLRERVASALGP